LETNFFGVVLVTGKRNLLCTTGGEEGKRKRNICGKIQVFTYLMMHCEEWGREEWQREERNYKTYSGCITSTKE
jgi:hypothetical protein